MTSYIISTEACLVMCENKLFNKLFFFSLVFLFISAITHVVFIASAHSVEDCEAAPKKAKIQIQQKEIMDRLKGVESRLSVSREK